MPSGAGANSNMEPVLNIPKPKELEWIDLHAEMRASLPLEDGSARFGRKFRENPFVPIGSSRA